LIHRGGNGYRIGKCAGDKCIACKRP
jgi:hypothetical protein